MVSYLHDIFVSYSSIDRRWVEKFIEDLEEEVSKRAGRHVSAWWDRQNIGPGDDWNEKMLDDARRSRVFIPVVSPSWLASDPCQRELAAFLDTAERESLLPAIHLPVESYPPEISRATYATFHKKVRGVDEETKGQARQRELRRLAQAVAKRLATPKAKEASEDAIDQVVASVRERVAPKIMEKCGWMRILNMSQRIDAGQIYTEVNVFDRVRAKQLRSIKEIRSDPKPEDFGAESVVKRLPAKEAIAAHPRLMIVGRPGAGKSTFLRRLAVESIRGEYRPDLAPAYIEFRALAAKSISDTLRDFWERDPLPILSAGRALLLLDGLDELPAGDFETIRLELDSLLTSDSRSPVLVTSRIAAREYVSERFDETEMAEFTPEQIEHFSCCWFPARGYPNKVDPFNKQIKNNAGIRELAKSPLLLTMICLYFEEHQDLNVSRADLYSKGLDTLLERWDATRDIKREESPYGRLSTAARQMLYTTLAVRHFEAGDVVFPAPDVQEFFREPVEKSSILRVMESQHGLLIQRAEGVYSFSHLTFQEFLTARHFVEDSDPARWDKLLVHLPDRRWREVFLLVTSMVAADYLVCRMQAWLNQLITDRPAIQNMLQWLKRKAGEKPILMQLSYLRLNNSQLSAVFGSPDIDFTFDRSLMVACDLFDLGLPLALLDMMNKRKFDPEFIEELEDLARSAVQFEFVDSFRTRLRHAMIKYRDIGHDFCSTPDDDNILVQYINGHQTLLACLRSERVTPATRARIESTLLKPAET